MAEEPLRYTLHYADLWTGSSKQEQAAAVIRAALVEAGEPVVFEHPGSLYQLTQIIKKENGHAVMLHKAEGSFDLMPEEVHTEVCRMLYALELSLGGTPNYEVLPFVPVKLVNIRAALDPNARS